MLVPALKFLVKLYQRREISGVTIAMIFNKNGMNRGVIIPGNHRRFKFACLVSGEKLLSPNLNELYRLETIKASCGKA